MAETKRVYGIDLGTTYSCISYVDEHGKATIVTNSEGQATTPSVVYFESEDNIVVGKAAKDVAELYPEKVVSTVKRMMGDSEWTHEHEGKSFHAQDISSFILRKLVDDAKINTVDEISDVVITCPAYFGINEKEATKQAGVLAGLNVRYIIPEPTAAAISYGVSHEEEQNIIVFDLGGGTFDVTVIEVKSDSIHVVCTGGDHQLGGKDWDISVAEWFAEQFSDSTGVPADELKDDPETWQELLSAAEEAKFALSSRESYPQKVRHDGEKAVIELSRSQFDEITRPHLEQTLSMTDILIEEAREKGCIKIDRMLLVGGSTFMPQVMESVKAKFSGFEVMQFDPNQAVAKGAALFGYKCTLDDQVKAWIADETGKDADKIDVNQVDPIVVNEAEIHVATTNSLPLSGMKKISKPVQEITAKSFGIVTMFGEPAVEKVSNLIVKNDTLPKSVTQNFSTFGDDQISVTIQCRENTESSGPNDLPIELEKSEDVGKAELNFTKELPKGSPIEITFSLSPDGLLSVHGKDLTTHQEIDAEFKTTSVFQSEELEEKKSRNLAINVG